MGVEQSVFSFLTAFARRQIEEERTFAALMATVERAARAAVADQLGGSLAPGEVDRVTAAFVEVLWRWAGESPSSRRTTAPSSGRPAGWSGSARSFVPSRPTW